jgi:hypothetical protein
VTVANPGSSLFAVSAVALVTGQGYYYQPNLGMATSVTLGNGTLRVQPVYIPIGCTIQALFSEFTVAGDAPSLLATCVYADNGRGMPGALLITGPTISTGSGNSGSVATAGTAGVYAGAITPQPVSPGIYWIGGVVQGVTTTQPTMRIGQWTEYSLGTSGLPGTAGLAFAYQQASITGALPATFQVNPPTASSAPRVGFQVL